jgi:3-hydroxyacyl-[acyl-carrier-protein] dehydratase
MRWFWIDRFTEFVAGQRAVALKHIALAEPHLHGYLPGFPMMPPSLILEGMAQTGGLLLGERTQFRLRLVLAKVSKVTFFHIAVPGDTLRYTAQLARVVDAGAQIEVTCHVEDQLIAEGDLFLAALPDHLGGDELFNPIEFARLLRILRIDQVARQPDGTPLDLPVFHADFQP